MPWVRVACAPAIVETAQVARPQVPLVQKRGTWSCEKHPAQGLLVSRLHSQSWAVSVAGFGPELGNVGVIQAPGRRFEASDTGPGARGNTASPPAPSPKWGAMVWELSAVALGEVGVLSQAFRGANPRLSLWSSLPEPDHSSLGHPALPRIEGSGVHHLTVPWGQGAFPPSCQWHLHLFESLWSQGRCSRNTS